MMEKHNCSYNVPEKSYGPAIGHTYEEDNKLWVTNGEYSSQVNYCPYCGYEAKIKVVSELREE